MRKHYERILHDSESRVQRYLDIQILDENSPFCGGFPKADSLAEPKTAIYRATTMTACYLNPESRYYLDTELGRRLALAHFAGAGLCAPLPAAGRLFRPRQLQLFFRPGHGFLHQAAAARLRLPV